MQLSLEEGWKENASVVDNEGNTPRNFSSAAQIDDYRMALTGVDGKAYFAKRWDSDDA